MHGTCHKQIITIYDDNMREKGQNECDDYYYYPLNMSKTNYQLSD